MKKKIKSSVRKRIVISKRWSLVNYMRKFPLFWCGGKNTAPATAFCASRSASAGAKRLWNIEIKNRGQSQRRYFSHSKGEWVRVTLFSAFVMFRARWGGVEDEECLRRGLVTPTGGSRPPGRWDSCIICQSRPRNEYTKRKEDTSPVLKGVAIGYLWGVSLNLGRKGYRYPTGGNEGLRRLALANYGYNLTQTQRVVKPIFQVF